MSATETGVTLSSFTAQSEPERYLARYDGADTSASMAVIAVLSKALGRDPIEMDQLYYAVDAEALDQLLGGDDIDDGISVTFDYEGHEVTATHDEVVAVRSPAETGGDARDDESTSR